MLVVTAGHLRKHFALYGDNVGTVIQFVGQIIEQQLHVIHHVNAQGWFPAHIGRHLRNDDTRETRKPLYGAAHRKPLLQLELIAIAEEGIALPVKGVYAAGIGHVQN